MENIKDLNSITIELVLKFNNHLKIKDFLIDDFVQGINLLILEYYSKHKIKVDSMTKSQFRGLVYTIIHHNRFNTNMPLYKEIFGWQENRNDMLNINIEEDVDY